MRRVTPGNAPNARDIRRFKEQLTRFAAASVRMAVDLPDSRAYQVNTHIIEGMELWLGKRMSIRGFSGLHSSSFPPGISGALQGTQFPWMSGRLALFPTAPWLWTSMPGLLKGCGGCLPARGQLVSWDLLKEQFGFGFGRMDNFKACFRGGAEGSSRPVPGRPP